MWKVAIIDTGVREDHPCFRGQQVAGVCIENEVVKDNFEDVYGHGTAIYHIIQHESSKDTQIINIKVKNIENGIDTTDIIFALKYACTLQVNLINLSLGQTLCDNLDEFRNVCKEIAEQNIVLVSAFSNDGAMSYPAAFKEVIGVASDDTITNVKEYKVVEDDIINVVGKGGLQRLAWTSPDYLMLPGNSFACAHVTAIITQIAKDSCSVKEVKEKLAYAAKENITLRKTEPVAKLFDIKKAAIFPFSKEMHSLIRFESMLDFKIESVYDIKYSGNVGAGVHHLLKDGYEEEKDKIIQNIEHIDWDSIDTLILGHVKNLRSRMNFEPLLDEIIKNVKEKGINLFTMDDLSEYHIDSKHYYYPQVTARNVPPNRQGKLYRYSKPVVGVWGTSSKQGKFTLQLMLRKIFMKLGYKIGQIGTEPTALLYGMDEAFPIGYNSSVQIVDDDIILYINDCINRLCCEDNDLILVGSQSGSIAYDTGNLSQYLIQQHCLLQAALPEVVVLCINPFDSDEYIHRTIRYIEACADCKVIGLVLFPMELQDGWKGIYGQRKKITKDEYLVVKKRLEQEFSRNLYTIEYEEDIEKLANEIIDYFVSE